MPEIMNNKLELEDAVKYLSIYLGESSEDCLSAIQKLWPRLEKQLGSAKAAIRMKELVSFCVLYETHTKSKLPDKPINLLFYCQKYDTLEDREWWPLFSKIIEEDKQIEKIRNFCLNLGVVHPIEYSPRTRQALNWVTDLSGDNVDRKAIRSLVYAYGGNVICNVFDKDKESFKIKKLPARNTVYFFERLIFDTYTAEKIVSIKKLELQNTSPKLVVQLKK